MLTDARTPLEVSLDDVKMDKTDQMNFLQDNGYVSDNAVTMADCVVDLLKLTDKRQEVAREYEDYLGEWSFLW